MNLPGIIILLSLFASSALMPVLNAQQMDRQLALTHLDSIIIFAREHSLYTDRLDWPALVTELKNLAAKQDSADVLTVPIRKLMTELGDFHGSLMYNYQLSFRGEAIKPKRANHIPWDQETGQAIYRTHIPEPYQAGAHYFTKDKIAYVKIFGTGVMDSTRIMAGIDSIRREICALAAKQPIGWIIDLRANGGGNTHLMMSGLGELIPNAELGGDTKDGLSPYSRWSTRDGRFYMSDWSAAGTLPRTCPELIKENPRIAVLVSRYTSSSGEVVASSFRGQPNVRLFGEQTAGYSTTNGWFVLDDKWVFMPATAYYMSVDGTVHKDGILPDEEIIENFDLEIMLNGTTIEAARQWIRK
ncbi:hypothetical protein CEQ90_15490 [Lewinellaceae bacterium SD302]|nr:hypothetical protein CEQ90_15490 [Lewinellaceae bacterium SD302]